MARIKEQFQTIRSQGALLPPDVLQRIASLELEGLTPEDYHLPPSVKLNEAISQSWSRILAFWKAFTESREKILDSDDTGAVVTRERWLLPLFQELGYGRLTTQKSPEIEGKLYSIERFWQNVPIHLVGCKLSMDRRAKGVRGAATASPHSLVQEFLNRSDDHLWAFVSNGLQLRILRDNLALSRQSFVEFDLEAMMDGEVYADFALLWLLCHQSRLEAEKPEECWLEKWSKVAHDQGTRILSDLRVGVTQSIEALGTGFISHRKNDHLRRKLESGELSTQDYYRQLLRIVYRMLFLFVAEERSLLHPADADENACTLYDANYSTRNLRELAATMRGSKHADLWHVFSLVCSALGRAEGCPELGMPGLGSFLWSNKSTADLLGPAQAGGETPVLIRNEDLLNAVRSLSFVERDRTLRAVDYRNLGSEELGSVYESLLELNPDIDLPAKSFSLRTAAGNERKTTGSYYTPDSLVQCLLDSALEPVVKDRLDEAAKKAKADGTSAQEAQEAALLDIKVCDPACGSGHFLIAAAHRLARQLARIRTGESEPTPDDHQHALRDVISRCVYGVDINPMAAELCKVSLWIESIEPGRPLSFLDAHIQVGNSLLGTTPRLMAEGIPDSAFKPIEGDVKSVVSDLKKQNKQERKDRKSGQGYLFEPIIKLGNLPAEFARLSIGSDDSVADVAEKERRYAELVKGTDYRNARLLADTWCAAFVWLKDESDLAKQCPTERLYRDIETSPHSILPHVRDEIRRLADQYQFFHWHLGFPDVFVLPEDLEKAENEQTGWNAGFDVVVGNPPWETLKLQEKEWFADRRPAIADAPNAAARKTLVTALEQDDPSLYWEFVAASRAATATALFVSGSALYPLCSRGDTNTFGLFAELGRYLASSGGRLGCILPTGIVTDDPYKLFFQDVIDSQALISVFDFENQKPHFRDVKRTTKFSLFTSFSRHSENTCQTPNFLFFGFDVQDLDDVSRRFTLAPQTIQRINPNTRTCPVFRTRRDAVIAGHLHDKHEVLILENHEGGNLWSVALTTLFHMSGDSGQFRFHHDIDESDRQLKGNTWQTASGRFEPLFEQNLIHAFDHRFASFEQADSSLSTDESTYLSDERHDNPLTFAVPRYWLAEGSLIDRWIQKEISKQWMLAFRQSARTVDSRTGIFCILPRVACGHSIHVADVRLNDARMACPRLAEWNSHIWDYLFRQSLGGNNTSFFVVKQVASISPSATTAKCNWSTNTCLEWVVSHVLELTYTAWDLEAFALDCKYAGPPFRWDEARRFLLRCELDAAYFHLYLGPPAEWGADSPQLREMFPTPRDAVEYIMETFPIVKRKDIKRTEVRNDKGDVISAGTYITKDTILAIYDEMQHAIDTGEPYQTKLDPPPGPPADEAGNFLPLPEWNPGEPRPANWPRHIHAPKDVHEWSIANGIDWRSLLEPVKPH